MKHRFSLLSSNTLSSRAVAKCAAFLTAMGLCISTATLTLTSCGNTSDEYSSSACFLRIDNSVHQSSVLATALQYPGSFVTVTMTTKNGARYYHVVSNQGQTDDIQLNALDQRYDYILGYNGALIVGYGNSLDGSFYAYDRECPNCFDPDALPIRSYPISVDENGFGTCSNCQRTYNLNNQGLVSTGDAGNSLTRYPASTTGPWGILIVQ
jgi:hypothetical protein